MSPEALLVTLLVRHRRVPDADAKAPSVKLGCATCRRARSRTARAMRMMRYAAAAAHICVLSTTYRSRLTRPLPVCGRGGPAIIRWIRARQQSRRWQRILPPLMPQPARPSLQASPIGTCSSWSSSPAATTGERHPLPPPASLVAPACKRPIGALPRPSASLFPLSLSRLSSASLHRRVSAITSASCRPKRKQTKPMVTAIDLAASRTVIGGVGGEERPPMGDLLDGRGRRREAVCC